MPISGTTTVLAPVAPTDAASNYPATDSRYAKGGCTTWAATLAELQSLTLNPTNRRQAGMICFTSSDSKYWQLAADLVTFNPFLDGLAAPTSLVGLTAISGTSTKAMRSDGAPALNQAITPNWTGSHTFTPPANQAAVVVNQTSGVGINVTATTAIVATGNVDIAGNTSTRAQNTTAPGWYLATLANPTAANQVVQCIQANNVATNIDVGFNTNTYSITGAGGNNWGFNPGVRDNTAIITVAASTGPYVFEFGVQTPSVSSFGGTRAVFVFDMPASSNPTINIRNLNATGTILYVIRGNAARATRVVVTLVHNGVAWILVSAIEGDAALIPWSLSFSGTTVTVRAGTRRLQTGAVISYPGGTIAVPTDGTWYLHHTDANALQLLPTYPAGTYTGLFLGVIVRAAGVITSCVGYNVLGGDMSKAENLAGLPDNILARQNLGTVAGSVVGTAITGAGDTPIVVLTYTQQSVLAYQVSAATAAYTRTVSVQNSGQPQIGARVVMQFNLPAVTSATAATSGSPTIEVRNNNSTGTLLYSCTAHITARLEVVEVIWTGTAWQLVNAGTEPHASAETLNVICNAAPVGAAFRFDGVVGRLAQSRITGPAFGTNDYTAVITFVPQLNTNTVSNQGIMAWGGGFNGTGPGEVGLFALASSGGFTVFIRNSAGVLADSRAINLTPYLGRAIMFSVARRSGVIEVSVNGGLIPGSAMPLAAEPMTTVNPSFIIGNINASTPSYTAPIYSAQLYNRALNAVELRQLMIQGVDPADRNATGVVYVSDFSSTTDGWVASAAGGANTSVARDAGPVGGQTNLLRLTSSSVPVTQSFCFKTSVLPIRNRRYRMSAIGYIPATNALMNGLNVQLANIPSLISATMTTLNAWTPMTLEGLDNSLFQGSNTGILGNALSNGLLTWTGVNTDVAYYRDITITSIGCLVDIDGGTGVGFSFTDVQGRYPAIVSPVDYVGVQHIIPRRAGQNVSTITAIGNTQITGLPSNCRITSVVVSPTANSAFFMGTASGLSDIISSTVVQPGRNYMSVARAFTSTQNLWVNMPTVGAMPTTVTITFETVDSTVSSAVDLGTGGLVLGAVSSFSTTNQIVSNTDYTVALDTDQYVSGAGIVRSGNNFNVTQAGVVSLTVYLQVTQGISASTLTCWFTKNGVALPNSASRFKSDSVNDENVFVTVFNDVSSATSLAPDVYQIHCISSVASAVTLTRITGAPPAPTGPSVYVRAALTR